MPDDDRLLRDHGPGWKAVLDFYAGRRAALGPGEEAPPDGRNPPRIDRAVDSAVRRTLRGMRPHPGAEDWRAAADEARRISGALAGGTEDDLCAGSTRSGSPALLRQAVRVVAGSGDLHAVLDMSSDALAEEIAREYIRGAARRYGVDRAVFAQVADIAGSAVELIAGIDLFVSGPLVGPLIGDLLSGALFAPARSGRRVA